MNVAPGDWIITGIKGECYPCKPDIFAATYEEVPQAPESTLPPYRQRVLDEKQELDIRITRLDEFILRNALFRELDPEEQARMRRQLDVMRELSVILGERISAF
ncbi:PGDYG domain-containing protein [Comamonas sp. Tr-654]|uniref:PGDYG domain-containing protein n=1 Tax=Comamonas sp. Tr-654 TaxID=2608341 RepID=UPI001F037EC7|nr:PGDYG domain-containing protein [Comamonas sp. Tr-654]